MKTTADKHSAKSNAAIDMARQVLYRFAAISFSDPQVEVWDSFQELAADPLVHDAAKLLRQEPRAAAVELGRGELPLGKLRPEMVLQRLPSSLRELNLEYEQTFGLLVSCACPPYETEYIGSKFTFQRSNALADVAGFYRAFGLELSRSHPERHDHIALELEFMAYLIGLERTAAAKHSQPWHERRAICRNAQRRFLTEHLSWWTPAFAHLLTRQNPGGFYEAAGMLLAALVPAERTLFGAPIMQTSEIKPSVIDRPEECEGCALAN